MLGEQLAAVDATGVTAALAEYQRIRVPRANKTVRMARRVGDVARMQNRLGWRCGMELFEQHPLLC